MLTTDQIKAVVADYFKDKPVKKVYLFGSYARGEANEESDVDLLVDLDNNEGAVGWKCFVWYQDLEKMLLKKTDVLTNVERPEHTNNWKFIERVNKEKKLIYEKE